VPRSLSRDSSGRWCNEIGVHDPVVFTAVSLVLVRVALVPVLVPAARAGRVDPVVSILSSP
jgi:hypothetical protein